MPRVVKRMFIWPPLQQGSRLRHQAHHREMTTGAAHDRNRIPLHRQHPARTSALTLFPSRRRNDDGNWTRRLVTTKMSQPKTKTKHGNLPFRRRPNVRKMMVRSRRHPRHLSLKSNCRRYPGRTTVNNTDRRRHPSRTTVTTIDNLRQRRRTYGKKTTTILRRRKKHRRKGDAPTMTAILMTPRMEG